jgi:IS30 family transposase
MYDRSPSTISRELRRNAFQVCGKAEYGPFDAHHRATARRACDHRRRAEVNPELRELLACLPAFSAAESATGQPGFCIAGFRRPVDVVVLRIDLPRHLPAEISLSQALGAGAAPSLTIADGGVIIAVRTGKFIDDGRDSNKPMRSINERPFLMEDRSEPGHWEGT